MTPNMGITRARVTPAAVAGATVLLVVTSAVLAARTPGGVGEAVAGHAADTWLAGAAFGVIGALLLRDAPGNRLGPAMAGAGLLASLASLGAEVAASPDSRFATLGAWAAAVLWLPAFVGLTVLVPLWFPDGQLPSPGWRWPARIGIGSAVAALVLLVTTQAVVDDATPTAVRNPLDLPVPDGPQLVVATACFVVAVGVGLAAAVGILVRMRRVDTDERGRYAWFATAILLGLLTTLPLPAALAFVVNLASFAALGVGIVRHRLFDIEPVLSRALVYLVLSLVVLAAYLGTSVVLGRSAGPGVLPAVVASVAAVLLAQVQGWLHVRVRRVLYGDRDDPARALDRLGRRLADAVSADEVLPLTVGAVRGSLRLPFVEIELAGEHDAAYRSGRPADRTVVIPLVHAGEEVGTLRVAPRSGERDLSQRDRRTLTRFARHVAVAAHGVGANRALQRSREQLVAARERERARIHRDLHDGLGPALAGITLGLETATRAAARDGSGAAPLLEELHHDTAACVDDVRRIVADLRPPALEAGLLTALRRQADLLSASTGGTLRIEVWSGQTPELPQLDLPPAVEVAAYRIASEAMTNAARHAGASTVRVDIEHSDDIVIRVVDDGCGTPPARLGSGLRSMRERAEELGGTIDLRFDIGTGTTVCARMPMAVLP